MAQAIDSSTAYKQKFLERWNVDLAFAGSINITNAYCNSHKLIFTIVNPSQTLMLKYSPCPECNAESKRQVAMTEFKAKMLKKFGEWPKLVEDTFTSKTGPADFTCECGNNMHYGVANWIWPKVAGAYNRKCSTCQGKRTSELKRIDIEEVKAIAKSKPTDLLVLGLKKAGNKNATFVDFRCACGHEGSVPYNRFKTQTYVCNPCSDTGRGLEYIRKGTEKFLGYLAELNVCTLKGEYLGIRAETTFNCNKCLQDFERSPGNVLHNWQWCDTCYPRKGRGASAVCIQWLDYLAETYKIHIAHEGNEGEWRLPLDGGGNALVDGYCEELNLAFEFHGTVWHGDPRSNKPNPFGVSSEFAYQRTLEKEQAIRDSGYNLLSIWEIDYWNSDWSQLTIPAEYLG